MRKAKSSVRIAVATRSSRAGQPSTRSAPRRAPDENSLGRAGHGVPAEGSSGEPKEPFGVVNTWVVMGLDDKSLSELEKLASDLRNQIARSPNHSAMETVELEDVEGWIKLRRKEAKPGPRSDDDITF